MNLCPVCGEFVYAIGTPKQESIANLAEYDFKPAHARCIYPELKKCPTCEGIGYVEEKEK